MVAKCGSVSGAWGVAAAVAMVRFGEGGGDGWRGFGASGAWGVAATVVTVRFGRRAAVAGLAGLALLVHGVLRRHRTVRLGRRCGGGWQGSGASGAWGLSGRVPEGAPAVALLDAVGAAGCGSGAWGFVSAVAALASTPRVVATARRVACRAASIARFHGARFAASACRAV